MPVQGVFLWIGCASAAASGALGLYALVEARHDTRLKRLVKGAVVPVGGFSSDVLSTGLAQVLVESLIRESAPPPARGLPQWAGVFFSMGMGDFDRKAKMAGIASRVTVEGAARTRMTACMLLASVLGVIGYLFSWQLAVFGVLSGGVFAMWCVSWSLDQEAAARKRELERHLSEAIEVICLGLHSGLSFDYAVRLYCSCFDSALSREFDIAQREWQAGLRSREEVLRDIASTYDSAVFSRVVDNIVRAMRFGSPLADSLEVLAAEARQSHKASVEEKVMKAPVKMMLPVGTLILPSMLILVLGPVLLDLMQGF